MMKMNINSENMNFLVKISFSGILKFLQIFWSDLVGTIRFLEVVDINLLLILSRNDFKGPKNTIIFFLI